MGTWDCEPGVHTYCPTLCGTLPVQSCCDVSQPWNSCRGAAFCPGPDNQGKYNISSPILLYCNFMCCKSVTPQCLLCVEYSVQCTGFELYFLIAWKASLKRVRWCFLFVLYPGQVTDMNLFLMFPVMLFQLIGLICRLLTEPDTSATYKCTGMRLLLSKSTWQRSQDWNIVLSMSKVKTVCGGFSFLLSKSEMVPKYLFLHLSGVWRQRPWWFLSWGVRWSLRFCAKQHGGWDPGGWWVPEACTYAAGIPPCGPHRYQPFASQDTVLEYTYIFTSVKIVLPQFKNTLTKSRIQSQMLLQVSKMMNVWNKENYCTLCNVEIIKYKIQIGKRSRSRL